VPRQQSVAWHVAANPSMLAVRAYPSIQTMPRESIKRILPMHNGAAAGLPTSEIRSFAQKHILLTGAGGWIGSALTQALLCASPAHLVLLDSSERNLHEVDAVLRESPCRPGHTSILGSVTDAALLREIFERHSPQIIFHAAACKHVPLMESNPLAALRNNALGTHTLLEAALESSAETFVLVSTDKAADPHSIMGASKRIAELAVLSNTHPRMQRKIARLVNVLGSPGSVVPRFQQQIATGAPVTVTHPEAERYCMNLQEAVAMLLALVAPNVPSGLYIPTVKEPIKILDLARRMIAEHAAPPAPEILFIGLRPGEKVTETLLSTQESWADPEAVDAPWRRVQSPCPTIEGLLLALRALAYAVEQRNLADALHWIHQIVPEYRAEAHPMQEGLPALTAELQR